MCVSNTSELVCNRFASAEMLSAATKINLQKTLAITVIVMVDKNSAKNLHRYFVPHVTYMTASSSRMRAVSISPRAHA